MSYCIAEKLLIGWIIVCMLGLIWQVVFVYWRAHMIKCGDSRMIIMNLCILACLHSLVHYGVLPTQMRARTFFVVEMGRLTILFSICLYYSSKASGLLLGRKTFMFSLKLLYSFGIAVMSVLGVWVFIQISQEQLVDDHLCMTWQYTVYHLFSIFTCLMFVLAFFRIRRAILEHPRDTELD